MAKVDLHLHSKHSNRPSEWFLQRLGAAQSYTEPEAIYDMAKERGMDFVTITDHHTIEGSLRLAEKYQDAFTGVQATAYFPEDMCKIHLLVWGLSGEQLEEIQRLRGDVYGVRDYLVQERLAHSVAHATYNINNRLTVEHLEKLVLLFDVFESINASMSRPSNDIWYYYLKYLTPDIMEGLREKHGIQPQGPDSWVKGFTGGSDDHGGIFVGRAYTMANASSVDSLLKNVRKKKSFAKGRANDFHTFAFTVYKVAHDLARSKSSSLVQSPLVSLSSIIFGEQRPTLLDRITVLGMKAESGYRRQLAELIEEIRRRELSDVEKNLDLVYDRIAGIVDEMLVGAVHSTGRALREQGDIFALMKELSAALPGLVALLPFFTSLRHLSGNRHILNELSEALPLERNRKILWFTDTLTDLNGPSVTLRNMGWNFYAHGIDMRLATCMKEQEITEEVPPNTINLPLVMDFELPYYSHLTMKLPSVLKSIRMLQEYQPDEIFISTPGPVGMLGLLLAKLTSTRVVGIYHTDFTNELSEITHADDSAVDTVEMGLRWFYTQMDEIKVPTRAYINILSGRGLDPDKMSVFPRLIDHETFRPISPEELNGNRISEREGVNLLFVGRVSKDKNLEFLVEVYRELRERRNDINLVVAGDGPYREEMEAALAGAEGVTFLGRVPHEQLPAIYSQADMLVFPSTTDTFGMVVLEAQCCELPAVVSDVGGPSEIVEHGNTGVVVPALDRGRWVAAILDLVERAKTRPDEYTRMREEARRRATATYGWESVLRTLTTKVLVPQPGPLADEG